MNRHFPALFTAFAIVAPLVGMMQPGAAALSAPAVATSVGKAIAKYFGKDGAEQATEYLTSASGKQVLARVSASAAKQGGDEAVEQVARLAGKYGPDALAALDNSGAILPVVRALDELPADQVTAALTRLAAGAPGRELAEATGRFGVAALRTELQHPGVGLVIVRSLGEEGAQLASKLSTEQAIAIGRHADAIAKLPAGQKSGVLAMIRNDTERMVTFVGRFVEANPGKTLFTVATTTVILAEPERILGGDEIVFDADGNPIVVRKAGLAGRSIDAAGEAAEHVSERYIRPVYMAIMAFLGTFAALWASIKLWHAHRRERARSKLLAEKPTESAN